MGAWGADPFDNDDAGDWAWGFADADSATGISIVDAALAVASDSPIDAPTGAITVAAATVVTWLLGDVAHTESAYGADALAWVRRDNDLGWWAELKRLDGVLASGAA